MRATAQRDAHALRIRARRDVTALLTGAYRSAFRGSGLTFEELREYVSGDDVAWIEWNATARFGRPIVKRMREERELVLAVAVDVSDSLGPGFGGHPRRRAVQRAAAALAAAAIRAQDRLALVTFADGVRSTLPPARGGAQLERVLLELAKPAGGAASDAAPALRWASDRLPRNSVVILLSDLLFEDPGAALAHCARKHDLVMLRVADPVDRMPGRMAPVRVHSAEGGAHRMWRARGRRPAPLAGEIVRRRGADYGELDSRYPIANLRSFLERRAERSP